MISIMRMKVAMFGTGAEIVSFEALQEFVILLLEYRRQRRYW